VTSVTDATSGKVLQEETETSSDGTTWSPVKKRVWDYDKESLLATEYYEYSTADGNYVLKTKTFYYYYQAPSAVRQEQVLETRVYPNPAGEVLYVTVNGKNHFEYRIYSLSGALVLSGLSRDTRATLDVSALPSGVYLLKVTSDNSVFTGKIIKQ
jgi:hypothetical protein